MPRHYTRCGSTATSPRGTCTISPRLWGLSSMPRSEEHTSELQSHSDLVCRLLLEHTATPSIYTLSLHDALPILREVTDWLTAVFQIGEERAQGGAEA